MNLQEFKDDFAISKGYEDFAHMTRKEIIFNEDWHTYNDLINQMMKLFNIYCYSESTLEYNEVGENFNPELHDYKHLIDESDCRWIIQLKPAEIY